MLLQQGYILQSNYGIPVYHYNKVIYYSHLKEYRYIIAIRLRISDILRNTGISLQDFEVVYGNDIANDRS